MKPVTIRAKDLRKFAIIPIKAVTDPQVTRTTALSVLAALCSYCDETGCTFVSQARLASDLGISRQAVNKQLRKLRDLEYIVRAKRRYKGQTTTTYKVIYDDVKTEEEALANLSPAERIGLEERREKLRQQMENKTSKVVNLPVDNSVDKSVDNFNVSTSEVSQGATSEVSPPETPEVSLNRPFNSIYNSISDVSRQCCSLFLRIAESYGTPRQVNDRDYQIMESWVKDGLTVQIWGDILKDHAKWCHDNRRDYPRGLAWFAIPVQKKLGNAPKRSKNTIGAVVKKLRP